MDEKITNSKLDFLSGGGQMGEPIQENVRSLFLNAPAIICMFRGPQHVFELANKMFLQTIGNRDVIGKPAIEAMPEAEGQGYVEILDNVYATGNPFIGNEMPAQLDKGNGKTEKAYFNFVYQPSYNSQGEIEGILLHGVDVTDLVLARKKIEENEKQMQSIFFNAPAAIAVITGPQHTYVLANADYQKMVSRTSEQLVGKTSKAIFPELTGTGTFEIFDGIYQTGESFFLAEYPVKLHNIKDGNVQQKYFRFSAVPLKDTEGNFDSIVIVAIDITEQVEDRKEIEESEKQQAYLLKLSDALRPLGKPEEIEEAATKTALHFMGVDRCYYSTIEGDNVIILQDASRADLPTVAGVHSISSFALYKAVLNAGHPFVVDDVTTSNLLDEDLKKVCLQYQYGSFINVPIIKNGKAVGLFSVVQNIPRKWTDVELQLTIETAERTWAAVERGKAEEALHTSEQKYRMLFDSMDEGFSILEVLFDEKGKAVDYIFRELNNAHEAMTGLSQAVVGMRISEVMPELEGRVIELLGKVVLTGESIRYEHYVSKWNLWFDVHSSPVGGKGSHQVANIFNNITERKQVEQKIKESEERFRTIADASPVLIWTLDANGKSSYFNKTFLDFIGVSKNEDLSDWNKIVHPDDVRFTLDTINAAIANKQSYSLECRMRRADGCWRWVLAQGNPRTDANNEFLGFVGSSIDITEQKDAETKLRESGKKFEAAILAVEGIIWTNNAKGEMIGEQTGWENLTGQNFQDYQGYGWAKAVHPEDAQPTVNAWNKAVANKTTFEFQHRLKTKDHGYKLFSIKAVPVFDEHNTILQWVGVHTDISKQSDAAQKIKESEERFRIMADAAPNIVWALNPDGSQKYVNKYAIDFMGVTIEESISLDWQPFIHPDDLEATSKAVAEAVQNKTLYSKEHRLLRHDGVYRWFLSQGAPSFFDNGELYGFVGSGIDITERKEIEKALVYRTALLEAHNEANVDGILLVDARGKILSYNQRFIEIWNMPPDIVNAKDDEAALSFAMTQLVNPQQFIDKVKDLYANPTVTCHDELEFKDGRTVERNGYPVVGDDGIYYAWSWTFRDVTVQKNYDKVILESEQRFRTLAETLPQLVWMTDEKGAYVYSSSQWLEYSGLDPHQDENWQKLIHIDDRQILMKAWSYSLSTGQTYQSEARLKSKNGEYRWHFVQGQPVRDGDGKIQKWIGAFTDFHVQKTFSEKLEEQVNERTMQLKEANYNLEEKNEELLKMNKELEAFNYISSHDLQEPLRKIQTFASRIIATEKDNLSENAKDYFDRMNNAALRMQTLLNDLLKFSRISTSERQFEITDINKIVDEVKSDFMELIEEKNATIVADDIGSINVIPFQFRQLLQNLIGNALKFSKQNVPPTITIKSMFMNGNDSPFGKRAAFHLSVADNGIGFEKYFSERIFGVFQKLHNKDEYAGTGIGLSIVKKIVENHNGIISAESELGKGATFNIYIPVF